MNMKIFWAAMMDGTANKLYMTITSTNCTAQEIKIALYVQRYRRFIGWTTSVKAVYCISSNHFALNAFWTLNEIRGFINWSQQRNQSSVTWMNNLHRLITHLSQLDNVFIARMHIALYARHFWGSARWAMTSIGSANHLMGFASHGQYQPQKISPMTPCSRVHLIAKVE